MNRLGLIKTALTVDSLITDATSWELISILWVDLGMNRLYPNLIQAVLLGLVGFFGDAPPIHLQLSGELPPADATDTLPRGFSLLTART